MLTAENAHKYQNRLKHITIRTLSTTQINYSISITPLWMAPTLATSHHSNSPITFWFADFAPIVYGRAACERNNKHIATGGHNKCSNMLTRNSRHKLSEGYLYAVYAVAGPAVIRWRNRSSKRCATVIQWTCQWMEWAAKGPGSWAAEWLLYGQKLL